VRVSACELPASARAAPADLQRRVLAGWQRIVVEDNGCGIPHEIAERIFEPFFTTKEVGKGTGLGLATIWHLVTDAGGEITVESKPGSGSKFVVVLPRWKMKSPAPDTLAPRGPTTSGGTKPLSVLLVEDEPKVARTALVMLTRMGHHAHHVIDGAEAWSHLAAGVKHYDVLLLDVNMPRMSGVELVRHVRATPFSGRIVVMSGRVDENDMRALDALRVDHFLSKPFTRDELFAALRGAKIVANTGTIAGSAAHLK
jgi:CheY-like chemotaxis protein